jgi:uncharacterized HAD superfamily protein
MQGGIVITRQVLDELQKLANEINIACGTANRSSFDQIKEAIITSEYYSAEMLNILDSLNKILPK